MNASLRNKFLLLILLFVLFCVLVCHLKWLEVRDNSLNSKIFNNISPRMYSTAMNISSRIKSNDNELKLDIVNSLDRYEPGIVENRPKQLSVLHAVTYASHSGRDDRFCRAIESAIRHDFDIVILGWGIKWKGLSQKLEAAQKYASSLPGDDIILFTDAFDVLFTGSAHNILASYFSLNYDILFAGECGCWPHIMDEPKACFDKYPLSPTPYRYLNSGTWIGKASIAANMLLEVIKLAGSSFDNANDQKLCADMYMSGKFGIAVDFNASIFQSMLMTLEAPLPMCNPYKDLILTKDGRYYNKRTNQYPSVFHFNGGGKTHHLEMESKMWYKKDIYNTIKHRNHLSNYVLNIPTRPSETIKFNNICHDYLINIS